MAEHHRARRVWSLAGTALGHARGMCDGWVERASTLATVRRLLARSRTAVRARCVLLCGATVPTHSRTGRQRDSAGPRHGWAICLGNVTKAFSARRPTGAATTPTVPCRVVPLITRFEPHDVAATGHMVAHARFAEGRHPVEYTRFERGTLQPTFGIAFTVYCCIGRGERPGHPRLVLMTAWACSGEVDGVLGAIVDVLRAQGMKSGDRVHFGSW